MCKHGASLTDGQRRKTACTQWLRNGRPFSQRAALQARADYWNISETGRPAMRVSGDRPRAARAVAAVSMVETADRMW